MQRKASKGPKGDTKGDLNPNPKEDLKGHPKANPKGDPEETLK